MACLKSISSEAMRAGLTSILQAQSVSDSIIMSITGHKTHVMLHRYSHSADASKQAAADLMPTPVQKSDRSIVTLNR
jgi:hypothetical protein